MEDDGLPMNVLVVSGKTYTIGKETVRITWGKDLEEMRKSNDLFSTTRRGEQNKGIARAH